MKMSGIQIKLTQRQFNLALVQLFLCLFFVLLLLSRWPMLVAQQQWWGNRKRNEQNALKCQKTSFFLCRWKVAKLRNELSSSRKVELSSLWMHFMLKKSIYFFFRRLLEISADIRPSFISLSFSLHFIHVGQSNCFSKWFQFQCLVGIAMSEQNEKIVSISSWE